METFVTHIKSINEVSKARELLTKTTPPESLLAEIIDFAINAHEGQFRKSGEPYIVHPLLVASLVAHFGGDNAMMQAALLHDVVEDTTISREEVLALCGEDVLHLVDGMTKIDEIREHELPPSQSEQKLLKAALSFRKMLTHAVDDPRVLIIKLCDRLHNLLTLDALSPSKQRRIAEESLVVYAPIAHRLGISLIKNQIEDLCFGYLFPEDAHKISSYFEVNNQKITLAFHAFQDLLENLLYKNGFDEGDFVVKSRIKHKYSIFLKMQRKGVSIEEVLDLLALRVIVKNSLDCYKVLGILHQNAKPLISRFKDYIAVPKENGYQTIHTTLFYDNSIFEVQIRTQEMDKVAEYGIAAHWEYKAGGANLQSVGTNWISQLPLGHEVVEEFYEMAKNDLFSEELFVYSPKGDIFTLPRGATVLDFAYAVHTQVGNKATEGYVNKQKVPLLHPLKNGDICRIETAKLEIARCSWLEAVKTTKAKVGIKTLCASKSRELDRRVGKNILATLLDCDYTTLRSWLDDRGYSDELYKVVKSMEYIDDIIKIVKEESTIRSTSFFNRITRTAKRKKWIVDSFTFYSDKSVTDVGFDLCCHPKHGDEVVAFYNKGKATIHHKYCTHADEQILHHLPMVFVKWSTQVRTLYKLVVSLENKKGQLASFVSFLAKEGVNISYMKIGESGAARFVDLCELEIEYAGEQKKLKEKISNRYKLIEFVPKKDAYKGTE